MKLAASHIGWAPGDEAQALEILREAGCGGLEIAPTRVAGPTLYDEPGAAARYARAVRESHRLTVCSMQSIWYGQQGSIFGPERSFFLDYTKKAIRWAEAAGAGNLVFGCPKNRVRPEGVDEDGVLPFFRELGDEAHAHGTVLALEANPTLYGTNFINRTPEAFAFVDRVGSPGFKVNLDFGTMVANGEAVASLKGHIGKVNHVHISEPGLAMVERRPEHRELAALLRDEGYAGYISLEMGERPLEDVRRAVAWLAEVFA